MKLQFNSEQAYQLEAIQSVIDVFEGQPLAESDFQVNFQTDNSLAYTEKGIANDLRLESEQIAENITKVQTKTGVQPHTKPVFPIPHISLEMETGTGKTYTFLRTAYELNKVYGFKKFVIVVPSVAIREGTIKNLEITHEHFQKLYGATPINYVMYDSKQLTSLRNFAVSNTMQILVINIDSFTKDSNVINTVRETGVKPIEYIQATRPIVIIDEPQNFETEKRKNAIAELNPLCTLRYSATHKELQNLVYSLNPVQAYDLGLVKQIEVDGITSEQDFNVAFLKLKEIKKAKEKLKAKVTIHAQDLGGIKEKEVTIDENNNDLFILSGGRKVYEGYFCSFISQAGGYIDFDNGVRIYAGDSQGDLKDDVMKFQIEKTVKHHFEKLAKYKPLFIKVLSLFFIDRVANYRQYDESGNIIKGKFALWFEEAFAKYQKLYPDLINFLPEEVHNGYFSSDKVGKGKQAQWIDSKETNTLKDNDTYTLIMKDKERLLSEYEPLQFIFSHTALREGWDNPNVFQICTLNETQSELKKRQEIGRGLRLPVNALGERVQDKNINVLTVIANESYEDFSKALQKEIEDETSVKFTGRIKNAQQKTSVKLTKELTPENYPLLWEIWGKISQQTQYAVNFSTEALIKEASESIKRMPITKRPLLRSALAKIDITDEGVQADVQDTTMRYASARNYQIPDVYAYIQRRVELKRSTIFQILQQSGRTHELLINPQMFLDNAIICIEQALNTLLVDGIKYTAINGKHYEISLFKNEEIDTYIDRLFEVSKQEKTVFNYIQVDSGTESQFAKDCEKAEEVKFFFKIPKGFKIPTPLGGYIPDWAVIFENDKRIYFVAETKSTPHLQGLRTAERLKILCGEKHFALSVEAVYRQFVSITDLY